MGYWNFKQASANYQVPNVADAYDPNSDHDSWVRWLHDGKNLYGMEHICHHEPNSLVIVWLLIILAMLIERLYRLRYLHRGDHGVEQVRRLPQRDADLLTDDGDDLGGELRR